MKGYALRTTMNITEYAKNPSIKSKNPTPITNQPNKSSPPNQAAAAAAAAAPTITTTRKIQCPRPKPEKSIQANL